MIVESMVVGRFGTNCYFIGDAKELLLIDPGDEPDKIYEFILDKGYKVKHIVLTHCHVDHILAVDKLCEKTGATLAISADEHESYLDPNINLSVMWQIREVPKKADILLGEGDEIKSGKYSFKVIKTPGHTKGSICLLCGKILLSGDTLFKRSFGRTDLPTGNFIEIVASIKERLLVLDDDVLVYPGHGDSTTIGYEKLHNEIAIWED